MEDFKHHSAIDLAKTTKITSSRIYLRLYVKVATGKVAREKTRFRLVNPFERMNDPITMMLQRVSKPTYVRRLMAVKDSSRIVTMLHDELGWRWIERCSGYPGVVMREVHSVSYQRASSSSTAGEDHAGVR
jgi:hypothetical protein